MQSGHKSLGYKFLRCRQCVALPLAGKQKGKIMQAKIYHNPRCSKSRQTLQVLLDHHVQPQIVKYLETPPTPEELKKLLEMMKLSPGEIIRFKDKNTRELGLSPKDTRSVEEWIDFMVKNPAIIERPIVVINGKAVLGRPPEKVLEIL